MKLYSYWRSTTSYRVRAALALKGLTYDTVPVNLIAGEQKTDAYRAINPVAGVPSLVLDDGTVLTQSMAILEWLETMHPEPALIPSEPIAAAQVRAAAMVMAADVHPVNNLRVVQELQGLGHPQEDVLAWMVDWMERGLSAYQSLLPVGHDYSFGDRPTIADICLTAQLCNAHRWGVDMTPFTRLTDIEMRCLALPAFEAARPENQPDAA